MDTVDLFRNQLTAPKGPVTARLLINRAVQLSSLLNQKDHEALASALWEELMVQGFLSEEV